MSHRLFEDLVSSLRAGMAKNHITGQELARQSGVHWVTISRILNGQVQTTTLDVAEKLLTALKMKPEQLLQKIG